jgi:predicted unusual protein kinase regulating ubiquinone biosynthesis (AarF/ABC1/UbiB family)
MFDLLALCRNYGLLVDREMIKYIRSLILVDGLVSRLEPQLDVAPQIRQVCEDFYAEEAQSKMFSRGAALTFMADLSGWLLSGPGQLLDSLERLERRQFTIRTRPVSPNVPAEAHRAKAVVLTVVWLTVATALLLSYKDGGFGWKAPIFPVLIAFWGGWTVWILKLLRGMRTRVPRMSR